MTSSLRRPLIAAALLAGLVAAGPAAACPMCKAANEAGGSRNTVEQEQATARAQAYMYSIFFMMSMPPLVLGGLTLAIRREIRRATSDGPDGQPSPLVDAGDAGLPQA